MSKMAEPPIPTYFSMKNICRKCGKTEIRHILLKRTYVKTDENQELDIFGEERHG